jgi:serine/threonine protein kinase
VYAAVFDEQKCVVKQANDSSPGGVVANVLAEALAMSKLTPHPRVVAFFGVCFNPYSILMEFVEGLTLCDMLRKRRVSRLKSVDLSLDLVHALGHVHECGIMHGDGSFNL